MSDSLPWQGIKSPDRSCFRQTTLAYLSSSMSSDSHCFSKPSLILVFFFPFFSSTPMSDNLCHHILEFSFQSYFYFFFKESLARCISAILKI